MGVRMAHDITADNVFHYFRDDTGQADASVVRAKVFLAFLEHWYDICPS